MALTVLSEGTQSATVTNEHTLATITSGKTAVLVVDTGAMVLGDELELRLYTKVRSGGASRIAWYKVYQHVQGEPNKYSDPIPANIEVVATLKQTAGTSRNFPWALLALD